MTISGYNYRLIAVLAAWLPVASGAQTNYSMKITFFGYKSPGALTNFPALVVFSENLPGFRYDQFASSTSGGDLRLKDSNETVYLDYEIEEWNTNGNSYVWVRLPELAGTNTFIRAYWGNASETNPLPCATNGAVWDADYKGVWHLQRADEFEKFPDATTNRNNGSNVGTTTTTGLAANCSSFSPGVYVALPSSIAGTYAGSVSAWLYTTRNHTSAQMVCYGSRVAGGDGFGNQDEMHLNLADTERAQFYIYDTTTPVNVTGGSNVADGIWHHLAATWDINGSAMVYVDGIRRVSSTHDASNFVCSAVLRLGSPDSAYQARYYEGLMDEVRLSSIARLSNWIWACSMNQGSNAAFVAADPVRSATVPIISNYGGVSAPSLNSAALNGWLVSTGGAATYVAVYWGTSDGGTNKGGWAATNEFGACGEGLVSTNVPIGGGVAYYYRYYATNSFGESWAKPAATFVSSKHEMKITFTGYDRSETLTNFPALVTFNTNLAEFSYGQFASFTNGGDLRFLDSNRTAQLNHEIEEWNTNGNSYVWVQVPEISGTNTYIWAYWGNPIATNPPPSATNGATWDVPYKGVWHFRESSGLPADSTPNRNTTALSGNVGQGMTGAVDGADGFYYPDGDDYITVANSTSMENVQESNYTVSAWFQPMSDPVAEDTNYSSRGILMKTGYHLGLRYQNGKRFVHDHWITTTASVYRGASSGGGFETGLFHHVAGVVNWDMGIVRVYVNGELQGTNSFTGGTQTREYGTNPWKMGIANPGAASYRYSADGIIDEARVEATARSADWIRACWLNQASNGWFNAYGKVRGLPRGGVLTIR